MRSRIILPLILLGLLLLAGLLFLPSASQPTKPVPPSPRLLTGLILGPNGPLPGATVRWKGSSHSVTTNDQGRFQIPSTSSDSARLTAWKSGHFIGGRAAVKLPFRLTLALLPEEDFDSYQWVDPAPGPEGKHHCANCHGEIYREWQASSHSRSATGRHFLNLYSGTNWAGDRKIGWGLLNDHPLGAGVCASCHAPTVQTGDPALFDLRMAQGVAAKGVHCDYCHKISGPDESGEIGLTHGRYGLKLLRPKEGQLFFGPLDDVDRGEDAYSPFYRSSRYCASCHEGVVFGVHVYSTWSEWQNSPARQRGQHCQDCHMRPTGTLTNIAPGRGGIERDPQTLANHRFFQGSQKQMLKDSLRASIDLGHGAEKTEVKVSLRATGVGHKVPTGFIDRHLILVVEGFDKNGRSLKPLPGSPTLPSAAGAKLHRKAGKLYAKLLQDENGKAPAPFWKATEKPVDTRLSPEVTDAITVSFPPSLKQARAKVIYRKFWEEVAQEKGWPKSEITVLEKQVDRP